MKQLNFDTSNFCSSLSAQMLRYSILLCIICCYLHRPLWANEGSQGKEWSQWTRNVWNGREYYYNTMTGESRWEKPIDTSPSSTLPSKQPVSRLRNHQKLTFNRRASKPTSANTLKPIQEKLPPHTDSEISQTTEPPPHQICKYI